MERVQAIKENRTEPRLVRIPVKGGFKGGIAGIDTQFLNYTMTVNK